MPFGLDPRGDLPPQTIQVKSHTRSHSSFLSSTPKHNGRRLSSMSLASKARVKPCHDWIFSSASNVHIALDRSAFKVYIPFNSYVLTLSDHRQIQVLGVGEVELKIRRRPDRKESNTVILTNVLHVPSWLCNIFSDIYFNSGRDFEHKWTQTGVQLSKWEENQLRPWGYTESFCSLDKLVLAKRHKDSRSPMLDDKEREVFSVNVTWPQYQRGLWDQFVNHGHDRQLFRGLPFVENHDQADGKAGNQKVVIQTIPRRATLSSMSTNVVTQAPSKRVSSLKPAQSRNDLSRAMM